MQGPRKDVATESLVLARVDNLSRYLKLLSNKPKQTLSKKVCFVLSAVFAIETKHTASQGRPFGKAPFPLGVFVLARVAMVNLHTY